MRSRIITDSGRLGNELLRLVDSLPMLPSQREIVTAAGMLLLMVEGEIAVTISSADSPLRKTR